MLCREKFIVSTRRENAKKGNFQIVTQDVFSCSKNLFFQKKIEARIILKKSKEGCKIYLFNHEENIENFIEFTDITLDEDVT